MEGITAIQNLLKFMHRNDIVSLAEKLLRSFSSVRRPCLFCCQGFLLSQSPATHLYTAFHWACSLVAKHRCTLCSDPVMEGSAGCFKALDLSEEFIPPPALSLPMGFGASLWEVSGFLSLRWTPPPHPSTCQRVLFHNVSLGRLFCGIFPGFPVPYKHLSGLAWPGPPHPLTFAPEGSCPGKSAFEQASFQLVLNQICSSAAGWELCGSRA